MAADIVLETGSIQDARLREAAGLAHQTTTKLFEQMGEPRRVTLGPILPDVVLGDRYVAVGDPDSATAQPVVRSTNSSRCTAVSFSSPTFSQCAPPSGVLRICALCPDGELRSSATIHPVLASINSRECRARLGFFPWVTTWPPSDPVASGLDPGSVGVPSLAWQANERIPIEKASNHTSHLPFKGIAPGG